MIDELKAEVEHLGLGNKVYFTGYMDHKSLCKLYKCADISVFPSTYEPFGIVALEGMLAGNPIVVSDIGGLNEIVEHGVNLTMYSGIERDFDFRRNYASDNEKIILYAGRLVYEKGVQYLIGAMPKILQNYNDA